MLITDCESFVYVALFACVALCELLINVVSFVSMDVGKVSAVCLPMCILVGVCR